MLLRRIAYIVKYFPRLTQTFVLGEVCELRRRGIDVLIVSLDQPSEILRHELIERAGLDQLTVYPPQNFAARLEEFQPQLLHAHFATDPTAAARKLAAVLGAPFTFTAHGYDIYYRPPADFTARAEAAAALVTVSEANRRHIASSFEVPAQRIALIPNGVDTDFFSPPQTRDAALAESPLIVCVARHMPVKNLELLLTACAILRDRAIDFKCIFVGDGEDRRDLEACRIRLGLENFVEMKGEMVRDEVRVWWRRARVAVLSSDSEGMPISLIEAAACGVPAVATAVGGIPELVENEVTGLLVPPRDPMALANALAREVTDSKFANEMGQAARRRVLDDFSLSLQVDRLIALWQDVLEEWR
jgi:colanic acid/amylovoran biosynthesis glycosyltransferase